MFQHQLVTEDFYNYQVWYFQILGAWRLPIWATGGQKRSHAFRFGFILVMLFVMLLLFAVELVNNISRIRHILKVFFMFATEMSCMTKLLHLKFRSRNLAHMVEMMKSKTFSTRGKEEIEIMESARRVVIKMRNFYGILSLGTVSLFLIVPFFAGLEELPMTMYEVCNIQGSLCYWLLFVFHCACLLPTCVLNITYDSVAFSLLTFLRVQLQMLVLRLEKLGSEIDPRDNQRIAWELRECASYYNSIVQFKDLVEEFVKVPGSVQLMCSVLVQVSSLYDISTISIANGEGIYMAKTCIYQLMMLWQVFIICYASNEVTTYSSRLCHAIYSSQWTGWSRINRRMILMMMMRFDSPLLLRTLNPTFVFSLEAFGSIVNVSYSYFALLKRVNS
ncbi:uncharacterized protein Dana_GF27886 [Drosophila ananassae]|uniref:Odorant receptor n=1 Tax=Drosophila ananassae TaxID=7217 RepID=A0A0P8XMQ7_DROAN|nr:uncharacterized protein Dana_GF27886 [Drosophila ananassae]